MKRLLIYTDKAPIYGAQQVTHALAPGFARAGWRVTVAQPRGSNRLVARRAAAGVAHRWIEPEPPWEPSRPARMPTGGHA